MYNYTYMYLYIHVHCARVYVCTVIQMWIKPMYTYKARQLIAIVDVHVLIHALTKHISPCYAAYTHKRQLHVPIMYVDVTNALMHTCWPCAARGRGDRWRRSRRPASTRTRAPRSSAECSSARNNKTTQGRFWHPIFMCN